MAVVGLMTDDCHAAGAAVSAVAAVDLRTAEVDATAAVFCS